MGDLRDRKKKKTKENILQSAKRLFISKGYTSITMSDIALDCEVGVGTLYNYYKSKSVLLTEIFRRELPDLSNKVEIITQNELLDFREKLHRVISLLMSVFHHFPRSFYRDIFAVISNQSENDSNVFNGMMDIDRQAMSLISGLLEEGKKSGYLPEDYQVDTSVSLIFSAMVMQIMYYLFDDQVTEADITNTLFVQIDFLLK